jgi:hypothetical protein
VNFGESVRLALNRVKRHPSAEEGEASEIVSENAALIRRDAGSRAAQSTVPISIL